eukprot:m.8870 g.8870  ORF g.8870 m.8870 type:complete len:127 (+) comp2571_c0_seq1:85-465(+)
MWTSAVPVLRQATYSLSRAGGRTSGRCLHSTRQSAAETRPATATNNSSSPGSSQTSQTPSTPPTPLHKKLTSLSLERPPQAPPSSFGVGYFVTCCLIVPTFAYIGQQCAVELVFQMNDLGIQPSDL